MKQLNEYTIAGLVGFLEACREIKARNPGSRAAVATEAALSAELAARYRRRSIELYGLPPEAGMTSQALPES